MSIADDSCLFDKINIYDGSTSRKYHHTSNDICALCATKTNNHIPYYFQRSFSNWSWHSTLLICLYVYLFAQNVINITQTGLRGFNYLKVQCSFERNPNFVFVVSTNIGLHFQVKLKTSKKRYI